MKEKFDVVCWVTTPHSWEDIDNWIMAHNKEERSHLYIAALMAWNFAADIMNEEQLS